MAAPQKEGTKKNHSLRDFKGVNTQADRKVIEDDQFSWLENVMPIGFGNAKSVPAPSAAVATLAANCYYMQEGNISNVAYMFMFCTDGSAYQVNQSSYAITTVGAAGTFNGSGTAIAQWKNERIVIIDPTKGYFDWNGTTLTTYHGTVASVTVTAAGIGFTDATTTTLTPSQGAPTVAATFSCTIGANLASLGAAGTGYAVGDVLTIVGGTFTTAATITVSAASAGAITGINLTTTGTYTIAPSPLSGIAVTGGHGTGATFTLVFGITAVAVATPGSGYSAVPTIAITGAGAGTGAAVTVHMNTTASGNTIAVYSGRVWIANGRTVLFTAPNSYNDMSPVTYGGSFVMTDDTLKGNIARLYSANNYLYIIGGSSINVVSNVTVTSPVTTSTGIITSPGSTTFSNTNISPSIGTDMGYSIISYYRTIAFAVDYGFMGLTGSTPQKMSDDLDGVFPNIDFTQSISGGTVVLKNILCLCFLVKYNDPLTVTARQLLCIYFNKKWFFSSQVAGMTFIAPGSVDPDQPSMFATDGLNLYKLFSNTTGNISQTIKTKLWDMGSPLITKQVLKSGMETISVQSIANPSTIPINVNIDTENGSTNYAYTANNNLIWTNNSGQIITWTNSLGAIMPWVVIGYVFSRSNAENVGNYIGQTVTAVNPNITYVGLHMQYEARTPWAGEPW